MSAHVYLTGFVGKDAERKNISSTLEIFTFSVGVSKKKKGEKETSWFDCKIFCDFKYPWVSRKAETIKKGCKVFITGEIEDENWTSKDGVKKSRKVINVRDFELCIKEDHQGWSKDLAGEPPAKIDEEILF